VLAALTGDPAAAAELAAVAGIPVPGDAAGTALAIDEVLWYNVFATADAQARLGGQPYDNATRDYTGSSDDPALNAGVDRFSAGTAARAGIGAFETTGDIPGPVVTLHTTGDPVVPDFQEPLYQAKVAAAGRSARLQQRSVDRAGHCNFSSGELVAAFDALVQQATARQLLVARP
jgi:hypothetical protein